MEFQRKQFDTVLSRIEEPRGKIQVIIGPRQVGKSTLMDQVLAKTTIPYTLAKADNTGSAIYIPSLTAQDHYKALLDYFKVKY